MVDDVAWGVGKPLLSPPGHARAHVHGVLIWIIPLTRPALICFKRGRHHDLVQEVEAKAKDGVLAERPLLLTISTPF